jgi:baculoviral IAP repeat-containing protein 7/8
LKKRNLKMEYPKRFEHPDFAEASHRLESFKNWPENSSVKPVQLVEAGFFYLGDEDKVCCFCCGGGIRHWQETDQPWEQHAFWYGKCDYVKFIKGPEYTKSVHNLVKPEDERRLCKICLDYEYNTLLMPCRHVVVCTECATKIQNCPYCREKITNVILMYFT